jgi:hypothetical protein
MESKPTDKPTDEEARDEAAARRREEVLQRVLHNPPKPHHPGNVAHQRSARPAPKGGAQRPRSR